MTPAKAMQERAHETIFFSVVGREHTITERSMGFVPYGSEEYSAESLTGIFEKIGRLKGVMPSHKMKWPNRASHGKGEIL
jgi:zeaxanthin glucosyltransferase